MTLAHWQEKIKGNSQALFIILTIILAGTLGFGLGRLSKIEEGRPPIKIYRPGEIKEETVSPLQNLQKESGQLVGSSNSRKYHYPWCPGARRIKEGNLIWFASKAEAEKAGYTAAANCPGL